MPEFIADLPAVAILLPAASVYVLWALFHWIFAASDEESDTEGTVDPATSADNTKANEAGFSATTKPLSNSTVGLDNKFIQRRAVDFASDAISATPIGDQTAATPQGLLAADSAIKPSADAARADTDTPDESSSDVSTTSAEIKNPVNITAPTGAADPAETAASAGSSSTVETATPAKSGTLAKTSAPGSTALTETTVSTGSHSATEPSTSAESSSLANYTAPTESSAVTESALSIGSTSAAETASSAEPGTLAKSTASTGSSALPKTTASTDSTSATETSEFAGSSSVAKTSAPGSTTRLTETAVSTESHSATESSASAESGTPTNSTAATGSSPLTETAPSTSSSSTAGTTTPERTTDAAVSPESDGVSVHADSTDSTGFSPEAESSIDTSGIGNSSTASSAAATTDNKSASGALAGRFNSDTNNTQQIPSDDSAGNTASKERPVGNQSTVSASDVADKHGNGSSENDKPIANQNSATHSDSASALKPQSSSSLPEKAATKPSDGADKSGLSGVNGDQQSSANQLAAPLQNSDQPTNGLASGQLATAIQADTTNNHNNSTDASSPQALIRDAASTFAAKDLPANNPRSGKSQVDEGHLSSTSFGNKQRDNISGSAVSAESISQASTNADSNSPLHKALASTSDLQSKTTAGFTGTDANSNTTESHTQSSGPVIAHTNSTDSAQNTNSTGNETDESKAADQSSALPSHINPGKQKDRNFTLGRGSNHDAAKGAGKTESASKSAYKTAAKMKATAPTAEVQLQLKAPDSAFQPRHTSGEITRKDNADNVTADLHEKLLKVKDEQIKALQSKLQSLEQQSKNHQAQQQTVENTPVPDSPGKASVVSINSSTSTDNVDEQNFYKEKYEDTAVKLINNERKLAQLQSTVNNLQSASAKPASSSTSTTRIATNRPTLLSKVRVMTKA